MSIQPYPAGEQYITGFHVKVPLGTRSLIELRRTWSERDSLGRPMTALLRRILFSGPSPLMIRCDDLSVAGVSLRGSFVPGRAPLTSCVFAAEGALERPLVAGDDLYFRGAYTGYVPDDYAKRLHDPSQWIFSIHFDAVRTR